MKKKFAMYKELAKYYDLIYQWKDYKKEVQIVTKLIKKYKKSEGKELLDVACGTGEHLKYLYKKYECTGVDINKEVLTIAKKKVKNVTLKKADMITLNMSEKFDIILCLFSAIGYVRTYNNLKKSIRTMSKHLKKGGIIIIEPFYTKKKYVTGKPHLSTYNSNNLKISRVGTSFVKGNIAIMDLHYMIAEKGKRVKTIIDHNELGLFEKKKVLKYMKKEGLKAMFTNECLTKGRGLFIGVKQ